MSLSRLRSLTGESANNANDDFPAAGGVYLVRDDRDDVVDDELSAFVREAFLPHTYRVRATFATTTADAGPGARRALDDPKYALLLRWLAAYASAPSLAASLHDSGDVEIQISSIFADAARAADVLLDRATYVMSHPTFNAGYEGTEHMVLKAVMLEHLVTRFPHDTVLVERTVEIPEDIGEPDADLPDTRVARPDLRVEKKVWVEVETLRGLALRGSNPFFLLENKLRRKRDAMLQCEQTIDDHDVDRPRREPRRVHREQKTGLGDVERRDLVREVRDGGFRTDAGDHAVQHRLAALPRAEVGREGDMRMHPPSLPERGRGIDLLLRGATLQPVNGGGA
jgi:hypothetical protein